MRRTAASQVRAVEPRSAAGASLRTGDRIEGANSRSNRQSQGLRDIAKRGGALVLTVRRGNAVVFVPLPAP